jgi:Fur family ferric uptake transcriptional regulator
MHTEPSDGILPESVRERMRQAGLRVTTARVRVLAGLTAAGRLLSHHDMEALLGDPPIDRVTLYRVLDSLVECGLAHRIAGDDRVWRFGALQAADGVGAAGGARKAHETHAHFQCSNCGRIVCLSEVPADRDGVKVPRGFEPEAVELTVRGRCPQCAQCAPRHSGTQE